jgi:tetratricopeptide (TPR) repeat protein
MSRHPLTIALAAAIGLLVAVPAHAQQDPTATTRTKSMREQREARRAELGQTKKDEAKPEEQKPAAYPNASRVAPEAKASGKMVKNLQDLQALYEKQDNAGVIARAEQIAAMPAAGAYEKSFAYSLAGNAAADMDDQAKAAEYFGKAVAANGLDNDSHFNTLYNLAVLQYGEEKYAEALATMDRFLAETKSAKPEHAGLRAGILANLGRNDEAAAIYKDLVAKNPTDKRVLMNAVAALQGADKFDQANVLLEDAYKRGMLTETKEIRALYIGYMNAQRWADAQKVIEDGVAKGVLQSGPDLARDYQVLAQNAYVDDKIPLAIDLYSKAAPMAADGEAYLNLAKVLEYGGKKAEAKAAAQKALDKGIKKPDEAKGILSR